VEPNKSNLMVIGKNSEFVIEKLDELKSN